MDYRNQEKYGQHWGKIVAFGLKATKYFRMEDNGIPNYI